jgi:hypothetical protein
MRAAVRLHWLGCPLRTLAGSSLSTAGSDRCGQAQFRSRVLDLADDDGVEPLVGDDVWCIEQWPG